MTKFPVLFNCRPFKYAVENNIITVTENGTYINNPGTVESEPILTVYGTGDITFAVNEQPIELTDIPSKIILNTPLKDAYDENGNSLNSKMTGQFPILNPGQNIIEWTGNVEKTEILPSFH